MDRVGGHAARCFVGRAWHDGRTRFLFEHARVPRGTSSHASGSRSLRGHARTLLRFDLSREGTRSQRFTLVRARAKLRSSNGAGFFHGRSDLHQKQIIPALFVIGPIFVSNSDAILIIDLNDSCPIFSLELT